MMPTCMILELTCIKLGHQNTISRINNGLYMDIYGDEQRVIVCWEAHIIYVVYILEHIHSQHDDTVCSALASSATQHQPQVSHRSNIDMYQH